MADQNTGTESQVLEPIAEIEESMAEDARQWGEEHTSQARDEQGRFERTNEPAEPEEGEADGERAAGETEDKGPDAEEKPPAEADREQQQGKPKAGETKPAGEQSSEQQQQQSDKRSPYVKNAERQDRSWKALNAEKESWTKQRDTEQAQLKLEREQFEAQQRSVPREVRDEHGITAQGYREGSQSWKAKADQLVRQALAAERAGDLDRADQLNAEAERTATLAKSAAQRAELLERQNPSDIWNKLRTDAPYAMEPGSPLYGQLRQALRADQTLFSDPVGAYRALVKIGMGEVKRLETELNTSKVESAKVPQLMKQIESLSAKLKELTTRTSLPGGEAALSRQGIEGPRPEDMSLEELEAWTDRHQASLA